MLCIIILHLNSGFQRWRSSYLGRATCGNCCRKGAVEKEADTGSHPRSHRSPLSSVGSLRVSLCAQGISQSSKFLVPSYRSSSVRLCFAAANCLCPAHELEEVEAERSGLRRRRHLRALSQCREYPSSGSSHAVTAGLTSQFRYHRIDRQGERE